MSQEFLESKRQQINMFAQNNSPKSILDVFREVRSNVGEPTTFYDFVGRTFLDNTEFYSSKFFKVYNKKISKYLNPNELFEMEQYILKNPGEEIYLTHLDIHRHWVLSDHITILFSVPLLTRVEVHIDRLTLISLWM